MKTLSDEKIKKFRGKLYHKRVSKLLQHGGKGLNPLSKYKKDEKGQTLVATKQISRFFFREIEKLGTPNPDQYFISLFSLFQILSHEAEPISFDCGFSVSEKDIQEADNKQTIELLITNIIITYFNNLKNHEGTVDTTLLEPDLNGVIIRSNAGRDYKNLVRNTLTTLISSLAKDKPWPEYLDDINDADLICRLTGAKLPSMEKKALAGIIAKSRKEIKNYNDVFTKILVTREQMATREKNKKKLLKAMEKMNNAILAILEKIDAYLVSAKRFMTIIGLSPGVVLGQNDAALKQNLIWLFLGAKPDKTDQVNLLADLGVATARYRLNMLFTYPNITYYCRQFKSEELYKRLYFDLFRLLFKELIRKMAVLDQASSDTDIKMFHQYLQEVERAVENLNLEEPDLPEEKQAVRDAYVAIIHQVEFQQLNEVMKVREKICQVTQDHPREMMADLRSALVTASFSTLLEYSMDPLTADTATNGIKKRLHAFAMFYKPQREFYKNFFDTYVGTKAQPISRHLGDFIKTNKLFAIAILMVLSDEKTMKELLSVNQTGHARELLIQLRNES